MPVNYYVQIFAKLTFNAIFTIGALIVTMIVSFFMPNLVAWQLILGTIAVAFASIGHMAWCIDMDVKNPTIFLNGNDPSSTVTKSTPKGIIAGLVIATILGLGILLNCNLKNLLLPYLSILVLSIIFAIYRVYTLVLRVHLCYDKIEM